MNLKEFITATLVEIAEGVQEAQSTYKQFGGAVNPYGFNTVNNRTYNRIKKPGATEDYEFHISTIEFEIGLTDNNNSEDKAGLGVFFGSIGLGGSTKESEGTSSATKVKFSIPVKLPTQSL